VAAGRQDACLSRGSRERPQSAKQLPQRTIGARLLQMPRALHFNSDGSKLPREMRPAGNGPVTGLMSGKSHTFGTAGRGFSCLAELFFLIDAKQGDTSVYTVERSCATSVCALAFRWRLGHEGRFTELESNDAGRIGVCTDHRTMGAVHAVEHDSGDHPCGDPASDRQDACGGKSADDNPFCSAWNCACRRRRSGRCPFDTSLRHHGTCGGGQDWDWVCYARTWHAGEACTGNHSGWGRYRSCGGRS
jgi:hypothetical protein